jgi:hypothetical protein
MHKTPKFLLLLLISVSFVFTGCPDPLQPDGGLGTNELRATATTEGQIFANVEQLVSSGSTYQIHAVDADAISNGDVVIDIVVPKKATVPYSITVGSDADAVLSYCLELTTGACTTYEAKSGTGSGTITITEISPEVKGTFSGTLSLIGGGGTRTLSSGEFRASF